MSWNKMADLVRDIIKDDCRKDFNNSLLECKDSDYYTGILDNIYTNQYDKFAIFHYGKEGRRLKSIDGLLTEARGLVIDLSNGNIISAPFKKFYNYGELAASKNIDQDTKVAAPVKLDGDMVCFRYYEKKIVTSGTVVIDPEYKFSKTVKKFYNSAPIGLHKLIREYKNYTCIFEMITLDNPHVVQYTKGDEGLYLIGLRDVRDGKELSYELVTTIAKSYGIRTVELNYYTMKELLEMRKTNSCKNIEGWVIEVDGMKVKLKVDDYTDMSYALGFSRNVNSIIKATADGRFDDFISRVPISLRPPIEETHTKLENYLDAIEYLKSKYMDYSLKPRAFKEYCDNLDLPKPVVSNLKRYYSKHLSMSPLMAHPNSYIKMAEVDTILKFKEGLDNDHR